MEKAELMEHFEKTSLYGDMDQILYRICFHGAPMIKRLKPASLICFGNSTGKELMELWDRHKEELKTILPFHFFEIKRCGNGVQVLFFWKDWLERIMNASMNNGFLKERGYVGATTLEDYLHILQEHFQKGCPHEIGIFLGYPLSDVIAFSSCEKKECIEVGYWKVYSNQERARKLFGLYDRSRLAVVSMLSSGAKPLSVIRCA